MAHKQITFKLTGTAPLMMHNSQLANPLNRFQQEIGKISSKRKKTLQDHKNLADLEFLGGLYTSEPIEFKVNSESVECIGGGGDLIILPEHSAAMLVKSAKSKRKGEAFKAGILVDDYSKLQYKGGPLSVKQLFGDEKWRDYRMVVISGRGRILRCRPIFNQWSLSVTVNYLPSLIDRTELIEIYHQAGEILGLLERRPTCGRFTLEVSKDEK